MSWEICAAGTAHRNDITTPHGRQADVIGGSAVYFSLAASRYTNIYLNGIVGEDCVQRVREILTGHSIDTDGLITSPNSTLYWHVEQDFNEWLAHEISVDEGCDSEWQPQLSEASRNAPVLFLASFNPQLQRDVLHQSNARLVGVDSMTSFIRTARDEVRRLVEVVDILFLNHDELLNLMPDADNWESAAQQLVGAGRIRGVVVKAGPYGAAVATAAGITRREAHPVAQVVDPTGAGDALAGGFLGYCASVERADDAVFVEALSAGLECAAAAISTFGTTGLTEFSSRLAREKVS